MTVMQVDFYTCYTPLYNFGYTHPHLFRPFCFLHCSSTLPNRQKTEMRVMIVSDTYESSVFPFTLYLHCARDDTGSWIRHPETCKVPPGGSGRVRHSCRMSGSCGSFGNVSMLCLLESKSVLGIVTGAGIAQSVVCWA